MTIALTNTLTLKKEPLVPLREGHISMYTCGPTVYGPVHIGNLRSFVVVDLLKRLLRSHGFTVQHAMNITDVDDKTIRDSQKEKKSLGEFTKLYTEQFFADSDAIQIIRPDVIVPATQTIPEMIELIQKLLSSGHAYQSPDGSVYFDISTFPEYGKLSHKKLDELQPGARVSQDEYDKDAPADFALWKSWTPADGDVAWESPFGKGRPGWHIECSAIAMKQLGESFDIHTGGVDLIFPHHENEIAQSESATGKQFVRHWFHLEHLLVDGKKMSKSLGNVYHLADVITSEFDPLDLRFLLLASHYKSKLNFTHDALVQARESRGRIQELMNRLRVITAQSTQSKGDSSDNLMAPFSEKIMQALADDLNTPLAYAHLFEAIQQINTAIDQEKMTAAHAQTILKQFEKLNELFAWFSVETSASIDPRVEELVRTREQARATKDFTTADNVRDELARLGIMLMDMPQGVALYQGKNMIKIIPKKD